MNMHSNTESGKAHSKKLHSLPRYMKYEKRKEKEDFPSFVKEQEKKIQEKLSSIKYNPGYKKQEMPPKRWKDTADKRKEKDCCKELLKLLSKGTPGKKDLHKPKQSREKKLASFIEAMPKRDSVAPQLFHLLKRFFSGAKPQNKFERYVFSGLMKLENKELAELEKSVDIFNNIEEPLRRRLFVPAFTDWSLEQESDPDLLYWEMMDEGMRLDGKINGISHLLRPGLVRPWDQTFNNIDNFEVITGPWPWINVVNDLRTATHRQRIDIYFPTEYQQTVNWSVNDSTGELSTEYENTVSPYCEVNGNTDSQGTCLRIAETRVGQSVTLTGFNYYSFDSRVLLTLLQNGIPTSTFDLEGWVIRDENSPLKDSSGAIIADHRVKDQIMFDIPEMTPDELYEFPPGIYQVNVKVPNDINYTLSDGTQPAEFISNIAYLKILPKENLKYRIWSDDAHCYDPTDGEWGSDELMVRAYPVVFDPAFGTPQIYSPSSISWDGIDGGDSAPGSWNWNILGSPGAPESVNGIFGLGIIGWEVDSEDTLNEAINSYDAAFTKYWNIVWAGVTGVAGGGVIAAILTAIFAKTLWWVALVIVAVVVLVILIVGLIWAAWAPPDRIILDMIVKSELDLYFLTNRNVPLPESTSNPIIPEITVSVLPEPPKIGYTYQEERKYKCSSEGSEYGIMFKYEREV